MMTKEVYQNCKFHDPQGCGSVVRRGHRIYVIYIFYSINIQHIEGIMMMLTYSIVDFHLPVFYDGAVDIQIWAPLTRVSDTQVTVKACIFPTLTFVFAIIEWWISDNLSDEIIDSQ